MCLHSGFCRINVQGGFHFMIHQGQLVASMAAHYYSKQALADAIAFS